MKVAAFILGSLLSAGIASAQPQDPYYGPPGGYGQAGALPAPAPLPAGVLVPVAPGPMMPAMPVGGPRGRGMNRAGNGELREALLARFDQNGDGRLEPNERRHAIRAMRKLTRKMARQEARAERRARRAGRAQAVDGGDF